MKKETIASLTLVSLLMARPAVAASMSSDGVFAAQLMAAMQPLVRQAQAPVSQTAQAKDLLYRRSVEFEALATQVYRVAYESIARTIQSGSVPGGWAVALDVDETVLDNTQFQIECAGVFDPKAWSAWCLRQAGAAVPGAKDFLDKVRALRGAHVVFITDRTADLDAATRANLTAIGMFKPGDLLLTKTDKRDTKDVRRLCIEKAEDPRCRAAGPMPIVALFGDSARDFDEFYGTDMLDKGRADILAEAGRRYWVLPNPMYGQWERGYK